MDWSKTIEKAASSPLGIAALTILVLAGVALIFFKQEDWRVRLLVFVMLFFGLGFGALSLQNVVRQQNTGDRRSCPSDLPLEEYLKCKQKG